MTCALALMVAASLVHLSLSMSCICCTPASVGCCIDGCWSLVLFPFRASQVRADQK